jgi:diguanylate cyclase
MEQKTAENHYDLTIQIARTVLPRMSELQIPITPSNYAVWFEYARETNPALQEAIDVLLEQGQPITNEQCRNFHERFISSDGGELAAAEAALANLVRTLLNQLSEAEGSFSKFSTTLNGIVEDLSADATTDELTSLIERALSATSAALDQGATLKAQLVSLANEMHGMRDELRRSEEKALVDPLTGLQNRLAFKAELAQLSKEGLGDAHTPCLLMVDIDHFKRVNDILGHIAGDVVIQEVGLEISRKVRGGDMVARYGGEEFVVLLRDTPRSGCRTVAENIRTGIEGLSIKLPQELDVAEHVSVTVSLGGGWFREGESFESFVDRADRALYQSKRGGRNRVTWEGRSVVG